MSEDAPVTQTLPDQQTTTNQNTTEAPVAPQPTPLKPVVTGAGRRKIKKPLLIAGLAIAGAVLVGGGAVFGLYLPNTPDNVYSAGLENTGKALDRLVDYSRTIQSAQYKGAVFDGSMKLKSPSGSFDMGLDGSADNDGNLTASMNLDLMGNKGSANIRSIHAGANTSPDLYIQVNGIKSYLDSNGMGALDSLDGQWISIDHTLIDTYASQLGDMSSVDVTAAAPPTFTQIQDTEEKVQVVNKQYLFTTNPSTAVLGNQKYIGQTTEGGRTLNHYQVGYSKDHLKAYVKALGTALDASKLNNWSKQANKGKAISDVMKLSDLESSIDGGKTGYAFDLWVDTGTRLVSKVTFTDTDPADKNGTLTWSQNYTGGDEYPFSISVDDKDASGNPEQFTWSVNVNTKTNKISANMKGTTKDATGTTTIDMSGSATPSMKAVTVTVPTGAKSVNDILNELGLGGLVPGLPSGGGASDTPLFFQQ